MRAQGAVMQCVKMLLASVFVYLPALSSAQAAGFIEDSHASVKLRNFYSRQTTHRTTALVIQKPSGNQLTDERTTWIQAAMLEVRSGYTQGFFGLGVDASLFAATPLERGHGAIANGGDRTLVNHNGDAVSEWSRLAVADIRLRASHTELKVGRMMVENPMLRVKDNRSLPSSFEGAGVLSTDLGGITLQAGMFDRVIPRTGTGAEKLVSTYGSRAVSGDNLSYLGATLDPWHGLQASVYYSRFEDVWSRYYLGLTHRAGSVETLAFKQVFTLYHTDDQGRRELGYIDNTFASLASTLSHGAHSFTLAYQQVFGDEYFDFPWETSANYAANSAYSDFNGPNEKSVQVRYDIDAAGYGIPGLTAGLWYIRGWGIDGTHYRGDREGANAGYNVRGLDGAKHRELGLTAGYVLQSGRMKGSSLRTIVFHHRATPGQVDGSYDELRLVTTVPFEVF